MQRPTVAMWSHTDNQWWIEDSDGAVTWFKDGAMADCAAFNNFLKYAEYLEAEILMLKAQLKESKEKL